MPVAPREYVVATEREIALWPGATVRHEHGSKHVAAVLTFGDRERRIWLPSTPGGDARRCVRNHITWMRHALIDLGAVRTERAKATTVRRRNPTEPARLPRLVEAQNPRPDRWFSHLAIIKQRLEAA